MSSPRDTDVRNAPQRGRASSTGTVRGIRVDARSDEGGNQDPPATAEPKSGSRLEAAMKSIRDMATGKTTSGSTSPVASAPGTLQQRFRFSSTTRDREDNERALEEKVEMKPRVCLPRARSESDFVASVDADRNSQPQGGYGAKSFGSFTQVDFTTRLALASQKANSLRVNGQPEQMGKDSAVAARNRVTAESSDEMSGSDGEAYSSTDEAKKGKGKSVKKRKRVTESSIKKMVVSEKIEYIDSSKVFFPMNGYTEKTKWHPLVELGRDAMGNSMVNDLRPEAIAALKADRAKELEWATGTSDYGLEAENKRREAHHRCVARMYREQRTEKLATLAAPLPPSEIEKESVREHGEEHGGEVSLEYGERVDGAAKKERTEKVQAGLLQYLQKVETDRERRRSSEVSEERADEAEDAQTRRELDFD